MKKILIAIPHYYKKEKKSLYASSYMNEQKRAKIVSDTIAALLKLFSVRDKYVALGQNVNENNRPQYLFLDANQNLKYHLDICICVHQSMHLLDLLEIPTKYYHKVNVNVSSPRYLGFGCLRLLKMMNNQYDYYCFLEDDIVIHDPLLFKKVSWFESMLGINYLLQPHRYITIESPGYLKFYCDNEIRKVVTKKWIDFEKKPKLQVPFYGEMIDFINDLIEKGFASTCRWFFPLIIAIPIDVRR